MNLLKMLKLTAGMHGRGKMADAPTSDAAMREGCRCMRVEPRPVFFCFVLFWDLRRLSPIQLRRTPNRADLPQFGSNRIVSAEYWCFRPEKGNRPVRRKKKKKKNLNQKYRWILIQDSR